MLLNSAHTVVVHLIVEDTLIVSPLKQLGYHLPVELRMSLHSDKSVLLVHSLHITSIGVAKMLNAVWICVDDIAMHLVDVLHNPLAEGSHMCWKVFTNQVFQPKQLLPFLGQLYFDHSNFPTLITPVDLDVHRPTDDLVSEAYTDQSDTLLLQHFSCELDQP